MSISRTVSCTALFLLAIAAAPECFAPPALAGGPLEATVEFTLQGRKVEATAISWNSREVHLLGRDGRLAEHRPADVTDFAKSSAEFRPFSPSEFRAEPMRELGDSYEVSGTGHYWWPIRAARATSGPNA